MKVEIDLISIGARLGYAMNRRGLNQTELAKKSGIHQALISRYISGKSGVSTNALYQLSKALDVSTDWLLDCEGEHEPI